MMTPDPREERLPAWVRETLHTLRVAVRDAHEIAESVKGEHAGSNVRLDMRTAAEVVPLPKNSHVEFDSKWGKITVGHTMGGQIRIQGDSRMILRMEAANALTVELED